MIYLSSSSLEDEFLQWKIQHRVFWNAAHFLILGKGNKSGIKKEYYDLFNAHVYE